MTFYEFAIKKVKTYLENTSVEDVEKGKNYNAFDISAVLEIIFDKPKEEIIRNIAK